MEAITFDATTQKLQIGKNCIPEVRDPNEVLIKVAFAGICGTDLHIIEGQFPCKKDGPIVLGHEFSGIVEKVGRNVNTVKPGDHVCVDPNSGCHKCECCHRGDPHFCEVGGLENTIGIYRNGGWAQYVVVPDNQVHKLPEGVRLDHAALCEPLSCLAHGWDKVAPIHVGQKILITGAGIIGNLWIAALHLQGHRKVTVSEPNVARLNLVKKLDTGYDLINPGELERRYKEDPKYLFDLIIDCSGYAPAAEKALEYLQPGGKLCMFGVAPPEAKISWSPYEIFRKELTIIGIKINPFTFPKAMGLLEALGERYLTYEKLGIATFPLSNYNQALDMLKSGTIAKATFKLM